ncbi:ATP-binding cassette domain-containing protein [Saccharibacillus kuerlensis]|uniref:ABC transporter ATP-binding protein n=1 Tax=Saccharibacillus kuerlensis TaxID=459527 RepID=A0ABQ2LB35_9BACL|nr:ABC transporter ATP-binding protein [Saccharibacillus kuerlensis]GGO09029.1 ABC transporter ATP-binding protein [Saccharibacillus kuerlensis]
MELNVTKLSKRYGNKQVLDELTLSFTSGSTYLILGKNGAGKSTFVNILSGNLNSDGGEIVLEAGGEEYDLESNAVFQYQSFNSFRFLKVKEVIHFFSTITVDAKEDPELYKLLSLDRIHNQLIENLSGGERKAVSLYLTFLLNKRVVVLDEPFSELDIEKKYLLAKHLKQKLADQNAMTIIISHEILGYQELFTDVIIMDNGKVLETGKTQDLLDKYPNSPFQGLEGVFYSLTGKYIEVS